MYDVKQVEGQVFNGESSKADSLTPLDKFAEKVFNLFFGWTPSI